MPWTTCISSDAARHLCEMALRLRRQARVTVEDDKEDQDDLDEVGDDSAWETRGMAYRGSQSRQAHVRGHGAQQRGNLL